ncbi:spore coat protein YutH [Bacillus sp. CLL-7-23]|uniref:Spore coat protein YutH n=1 Tax=Bacillus changyiensis TaxID=3004103 RepID=A0ABT4X5S0_9BACI|nr:spore coat protein YutH [Bacillus changyiensis]MDA7027548.1 spore coat protein YutH [Bacillus changyiensis]
MVKEIIKEKFGIHVRDLSHHLSYQSFQTPNSIVLIVPVSQFSQAELMELYYISHYLQEQQEPYVCSFILTKDGTLTFEDNGTSYVLLQADQRHPKRSVSLGAELAQFHQKGRGYPYEVKELTRIGQWKDLWGKRLDQLEQFWIKKTQSEPLQPFEKVFIESFPYYLGLTENAIQYLADTELDDQPQTADSGTICRQRLTWESPLIKVPVEWVFDHAARDLAEYTRSLFQKNQDFQEITLFLQQYEQVIPLSSFSKRLLFSRLLFPLHYFETVENFYLSPESEHTFYEKRLENIVNQAQRYEKFLASFQDMYCTKARGYANIPSVNWLKRSY